MKEINVHFSEASKGYKILIGKNLFTNLKTYLERYKDKNILLITNPLLQDYFGCYFNDLENIGFKLSYCIISDSEEKKTLNTVMEIIDKALELGLGRDSLFISLGGGVVGDVVGFAASIYMRGVEVVHLPTTLLAQVDSSIGGKTGVNHKRGKNLIGSFHQPSVVICDIETLRTLSEDEYKNGLAEVVKYGVIYSKDFFQLLESHRDLILARDGNILEEIIYTCSSIKAHIVSIDEKETGLRRILNFGHTIGHGIEKATEYKISHGKAVSLGMVGVGYISERMGLWSKEELRRLSSILNSLDLPTKWSSPADKELVLKTLNYDKKNIGGRTNFILPKAIGEVMVVSDVPMEFINGAIEYLIG